MKNTYSDILLSYSKRLITTSSRSRTIFFSKTNNYVTDFYPYLKFVDEKNLIDFLKGDITTLVIEAPKFNYDKAYDLFTSYYKNIITKKDILEVYPTFSNHDFITIQNVAPNDEDYTKLFNKYNKINTHLFSKLSEINENNTTIKKESGKDDLYIGYPYIEGQFNDEKVVRAPLILHKIKMERGTGSLWFQGIVSLCT